MASRLLKATSRVADNAQVEVRIALQRWWDELRASPRASDPLRLIRFGRKAYSQNDEDGIILEIFNRIGVRDRRFIEFGVQIGCECNTALLLMDGWSGLWLDGSANHVAEAARNQAVAISEGRLSIQQTMVTAENIDGILSAWAGASKDVDLLSIDIDGNDYWVWQAIATISPRVVVIEYNATYPPPVEFVTAYDPAFVWDGSNYQGASLAALERLGREKGYALVGCSISGANAFFVREDELTGPGSQARFHEPFTAAEHYEPPRFELSALPFGHPPRFGINAAARPLSTTKPTS